MLRPIVIENSILMRLLRRTFHAEGLAVWPVVLLPGRADPITLRRQMIRLRQQAELWVLPFFAAYLLYGALYLIRTRSVAQACLLIPFEREAYFHHDDPTYLVFRERNAWRRYA
jgi:hypothetical protein